MAQKSSTGEPTLITEISKKHARAAQEFAEEVPRDRLPFDSLFGPDEKWRRIVEFGSQLDDDSIIGEIIDFFEENEHGVNLRDGTTTYQYEIPAGPKKGEVTSSTSKLGKRLNGLESFYENLIDIIKELQEGNNKDAESDLNDLLKKMSELYPYQAPYELSTGRPSEIRFDYNYHKSGPQSGGMLKFLQGDFEDQIEKIQDWQEFWNANSKEIINNPESVYNDYYIIISRHPLDILRMSDFKNISSCMREGGSYFNSALAEMRANGAVAYLVEEEDIEAIDDLQKDEIFEDPDRDVPGIEPISRGRFRRYVDIENDIELAVPERTSYGESIPGFTGKLKDIADETQQEAKQNYEGGTLNLGNFALFGGSYTDTISREHLGWFMGTGTDVEGSLAHKGIIDDEEIGFNVSAAQEKMEDLERRVENLDFYLYLDQEVQNDGSYKITMGGKIELTPLREKKFDSDTVESIDFGISPPSVVSKINDIVSWNFKEFTKLPIEYIDSIWDTVSPLPGRYLSSSKKDGEKLKKLYLVSGNILRMDDRKRDSTLSQDIRKVESLVKAFENLEEVYEPLSEAIFREFVEKNILDDQEYKEGQEIEFLHNVISTDLMPLFSSVRVDSWGFYFSLKAEILEGIYGPDKLPLEYTIEREKRYVELISLELKPLLDKAIEVAKEKVENIWEQSSVLDAEKVYDVVNKYDSNNIEYNVALSHDTGSSVIIALAMRYTQKDNSEPGKELNARVVQYLHANYDKIVASMQKALKFLHKEGMEAYKAGGLEEHMIREEIKKYVR